MTMCSPDSKKNYEEEVKKENVERNASQCTHLGRKKMKSTKYLCIKKYQHSK